MTTPAPGSSYPRLFRNHNFMALWIGQMISFIGDYFVYLAIPIVVNRLTGSAMMVGLSLISSAIPALVLGPIAGVFVDRWDRRKTMIFSDIIRAVLVLFCLLVHTKEQVWIFYVVAFLMSTTSQFFFPSRGALLPLIVPESEDWLAANGLMQIIQTVGMVAGPSLAGFAIGLYGERVAFIVNCFGFIISAVAVLIIRYQKTASQEDHQPASLGAVRVWRDLREGMAYLFGSRTLVGIMACMCVLMLGIGAINVVWVPYLQRTFGVGATGLGIVDSSQGIGMVIGGLLLGFIASKFSKKAMVAVGAIVIGIAIGAMGLAPTFSFIIVMGFIVGLGIVPANSGMATMMQMAVPDLKRGRVGSSLNAFSTAASLISMAFAALMGDLIGLRTVYVVFGAFIGLSGLLCIWVVEEPKEQAIDTPALAGEPIDF
jgi:MFS transporter, DHA3 family, macrolide efflux protein